jgi:hypothetical protein
MSLAFHAVSELHGILHLLSRWSWAGLSFDTENAAELDIGLATENQWDWKRGGLSAVVCEATHQ